MRVRIYRPAKTALQSRCGCDAPWVIAFAPPTPRQVEPLMGWTAARDPMSTMAKRLLFATQGEALTFARARGWDFDLETPQERRAPPKSYLDNFNPDRRRAGR